MSAKRRARRGDGSKPVRYATPVCPTSKKAFVTRSEAHTAAVRIQKQEGGERMSAYKCRECAYYHTGHLPRAVKRGEITRDEYRKDVA